ncbi:MAG TPA: hypothetical protein DDX05_08530 [Deltaproteobacteria bacterium]|nr:MAG: hypothetical protein A2X90_09455 [Deltaproteobacteria bacterium GWA2_65_63]OGP77365.1 MAG: hypothetical protein A2Z26_06510 [Deltaproteobacteria bacterium RBG_16_66_15]HAM33409.1 hypothetical protein [Deltaproteobacteria bacterium]HBG73648.1 hypothetical protein [Deltaproteobacteria bacterium]
MRGRSVSEGIRFAAGVASDPSGVVILWKALTGGKVVGWLPSAFAPVPEILHAAGLLPIALESGEDRPGWSGRIDVWMEGDETKPANVEEALDRVEALVEWTGNAAGRPASEGAIWKSLRAYAIRRSLLATLDERCARETEFLTPAEHKDIVRAGIFLPPEAHSRLLSTILGLDDNSVINPSGEERGDPLLVLAKRIVAG